MDISNQFIDQLFHNDHFKSSFLSLWSSFQTQTQEKSLVKETFEIQSVVEEISEVLSINFKNVIDQQCNHLYESNRQLLQQVEQIKSQLKGSPHLKTQSSTAERDTNPKLQTSIFFQTDSQYDMKQIRRHFDQQIENKVLINSFEIDQQQRTYIDQEIQEKINASIQGSINRIELTLQEKFDKYSTKIQLRIQQLKKTIASVVQAMNQKEFWNKDLPKTSNTSNNRITQNAFSKKQPKPQQNQNYSLKDIPQQSIQNSTNQTKVKNPQKQTKKIEQNPHSNSNKAMQSLNKSINLGRTRIKSLFGFKSTTVKQQKNQS